MKYVSTNHRSTPVSFAAAIRGAVADDGGLLMPESLPSIPRALFNNISEMSLREIAFVVAETILGDDVPGHTLKAAVDYAFACDAPLRHLHDNIYALELFHGPSLTFKDYGARFMARLLPVMGDRHGGTVLVATTGNTGAAAANGFYKADGVNVCVLYPRGRLSRSQTSMITAFGGNVHPIEVAGSIEDCKVMMQKAIADPELAPMCLTTANSLNIGRLIPQIAFAMHAYARLVALEVPNASEAHYVIPTGNMSNVVSASMARRMGLPMGKIVAATNANNQVRPLLDGVVADTTGRPMPTPAPALDMTYPSCWPRLLSLYGGNLDALRADVVAPDPVADDVISATVNDLRARCGYTIDPHGAVAVDCARRAVPADVPAVVFATGHPAKQLDIMTHITGASMELPVQLTRFMAVKRHPVIIPPTLPALRKFLHSINS